MAAPPAPLDPRAALDAIGLLPDVEIDIAHAALAFARIDAPLASMEHAREELSAIARDAVTLTRRIDDVDLATRAEVMAGLLVGRYGFRGDKDEYDDPANANLIRVIERRKGLPVALGVVWLHAMRAAGWSAHGIDFPAHFLVALPGKSSQLVIDVFDAGTLLDARDLRLLLKRVEGERAELRPGLLAPMNTRAVLLRLQNNIKVRRLDAGDLHGALTCAEDMLRIAPDHATLWREAALMHQRLDHVRAALRCYEQFLVLVPQGEVADRVRRVIEELRNHLI